MRLPAVSMHNVMTTPPPPPPPPPLKKKIHPFSFINTLPIYTFLTKCIPPIRNKPPNPLQLRISSPRVGLVHCFVSKQKFLHILFSSLRMDLGNSSTLFSHLPMESISLFLKLRSEQQRGRQASDP